VLVASDKYIENPEYITTGGMPATTIVSGLTCTAPITEIVLPAPPSCPDPAAWAAHTPSSAGMHTVACDIRVPSRGNPPALWLAKRIAVERVLHKAFFYAKADSLQSGGTNKAVQYAAAWHFAKTQFPDRLKVAGGHRIMNARRNCVRVQPLPFRT
jgi:hypothetical protein